jgi:hypothetical protein
MIKNLFLSVGAMKAGTTWLYMNLEDHPRIWFTPEKELHYFAFVDEQGSKLSYETRVDKVAKKFANKSRANIVSRIDEFQWYARYASKGPVDDAWYQSLFPALPADTWAADFSNLYAILSDEAWLRVRRNCGKLRVVYTLRDPLSRIWSHYKFQLQFAEQQAALDQVGFRQFKRMLDKEWFWLHAEYDQILARLRRNLKPEELLITHFEDFRARPEAMLEQICGFLELPTVNPNPELLSKKVNPSADAQIPDDWRAYAAGKLAPVIERLVAAGDAHPSWNTG